MYRLPGEGKISGGCINTLLIQGRPKPPEENSIIVAAFSSADYIRAMIVSISSARRSIARCGVNAPEFTSSKILPFEIFGFNSSNVRKNVFIRNNEQFAYIKGSKGVDNK